MDIAVTLWSVLSAGAALAASGAVGEFAKSGGKAAFEALKERLTGKGAKSVALIDDAKDNPAYADMIRAELAKPEITDDLDIIEAARILEKAIVAVPRETLAAYGIDVETMRAGGNILVERAEGIRAKLLEAKGDITLIDVTAPGKK